MCHFSYNWWPGKIGLSRGATVQSEEQHPLKSLRHEAQHLKLHIKDDASSINCSSFIKVFSTVDKKNTATTSVNIQPISRKDSTMKMELHKEFLFYFIVNKAKHMEL
jgi:hypothetical protein